HTRCSRDWSSDVCSSDLRRERSVHSAIPRACVGRVQLQAVQGLSQRRASLRALVSTQDRRLAQLQLGAQGARTTMRYILRRLGFYLIAAWVSLTLNFFIPRLMPGDPASAMFARFKGMLNPEAMAAMREAFGFTDEPVYLQYWTYLSHLFQG